MMSEWFSPILPAGDLVEYTSPWGPRTHPVTGEHGKHHNGIDLRAPQGAPLYPCAIGYVDRIWTDKDANAGGWCIRVNHGDGWKTTYCHLSHINVKKGDLVFPADPRRMSGDIYPPAGIPQDEWNEDTRPIPMGLTGGEPGTPGAGRSTGPHLHLSVWQLYRNKWRDVNPLDHIAFAPFGVARAS